MCYRLNLFLGALVGNSFAKIESICGQNVCLQIECFLGCENHFKIKLIVIFFNYLIRDIISSNLSKLKKLKAHVFPFPDLWLS